MIRRRPLVLAGAGAFGREVAWLVDELNSDSPQFELLGFIDDTVTATPEGYPVLGTVQEWLASPARDAVVACTLGDPIARHHVVQSLQAGGATFATLIHPDVRRSRWVEVEPGSIICAGSILTTNIKVGAHAIINLNCTVGHDCVLGELTSLMPGVHLSGDVHLGRGSYFGTGAVVINDVTIGAWTVVGAGAVVSSDLPAGVVAVGVPAKAIKSNSRAPVAVAV